MPKNIAFAKTLLLRASVACLCFIAVGCGGGGGATKPTGQGGVEGSVFVPDGRSRAAGPVMGRGATPTGYAPLEGAQVTTKANGVDYTATTDVSGHFELLGVPAGRVAVHITPPAGSGYRAFTAPVSVRNGGTAVIGDSGNISLLSASAANLALTVDSVNIDAWPTVTATLSVLDPVANAAIIGVAKGDLTIKVNGTALSVTAMHTAMSAGANPHLVYVLTTSASGAKPASAKVDVTAGYCTRSGSASKTITIATPFLTPLNMSTVLFPFKDPTYAATHSNRWHTGADISAAQNTRVNAIATGYVMSVWISAQDTAVVIKHRVSANLNTSGGPTRDVYVLYGCITPSVGAGNVVNPGQQIGTIRLHGDGCRLHLGVRVGEQISSAYGDASLVNGQIPAADIDGLTDGWTDPISFLRDKMPDTTWDPRS